MTNPQYSLPTLGPVFFFFFTPALLPPNSHVIPCLAPGTQRVTRSPDLFFLLLQSEEGSL